MQESETQGEAVGTRGTQRKGGGVFVVLGVVALCVAAFYLGKYVQAVKMSAVGASYRMFLLDGMARQLRNDNIRTASQAVEIRLDEEAATLARTRRHSLVYRLVVPEHYRKQVDVVLKGFIDYRNGPAIEYRETPLWDLELFRKAPPAAIAELEKMNRQRASINKAVQGLYDEFGGRRPTPTVIETHMP